MKKNRRLLWRLYPSYLFIALASIAITGAYFVSSFENEYHPDQDQRILTRLHILKEILHPWIANSDPVAVDSLCKRLGDVDGFRVTIVLPSGVIVGDSKRKVENLPSIEKRVEFLAAMNGETGKDVRIDAMSQREMLFLAESIYKVTSTDSVIVGVLRLSAPVESPGVIASQAYRAMAIAAFFGIVLVALVGYRDSLRLAKPLDILTQWAQDRSAVDLAQAVSEQSSDETTSVFRALNKLSIRLDGEIAETLRQKNEQFAIIQSMSEGVFALDMQERIVSANRVVRDWFSIGKNDLTGLTLQETARNSDLERIVRMAFQSQIDQSQTDQNQTDEAPRETSENSENAEAVTGEITLLDGRILSVHGVPLRNEAKRIMGVVIMLHDISELRKLELVRREFVANVSHELKTPITSIKGFIETLLLDGESLSADQLKFLQIVSRQSDRLEAIIDDLLILSRIEQGAEIEYETVHANMIVRGAISICQAQASKKEIRIKTIVAEGLTLSANSRLLEQALANLLDNAIKYSSPNSTVTIEVEEVAIGSGKEVVLRVCDQGAGIVEKHLPRLFERFYRTDNARTREVGGSGLGLAIAKHIVLAHKGQIEVSSTFGEGSAFTLRIPKSL